MRLAVLILLLTGCNLNNYPESKTQHAKNNIDVVEMYASDRFHIYKFVDGNQTCYISEYGELSISCVKNK